VAELCIGIGTERLQITYIFVTFRRGLFVWSPDSVDSEMNLFRLKARTGKSKLLAFRFFGLLKNLKYGKILNLYFFRFLEIFTISLSCFFRVSLAKSAILSR